MGTEQANGGSVNSPSFPGRYFSHLRKPKTCLRECLSLFKSFAAQSFLLSFMIHDKNWPFLILYKKYCVCLTMNLNWLAGIVVNHGLDLTKKFGSYFLIRTIIVRLLNCHTFVNTIGLLQLFLNPKHCPQIDIQTLWNLCIGTSGMNVKQCSMLFPNFWRSELCYGATFFTGHKMTLICCTVDKTWNKVHVQN